VVSPGTTNLGPTRSGTSRRPIRLAIAAAAATTLLLAGCGNTDTTKSSGPTSEATSGDVITVAEAKAPVQLLTDEVVPGLVEL
jgi:hypothetical protein